MHFVHLHTHSHYSLLEAVPKIPALVARAKELGMEALALTDHGALYGAVEFIKVCRKQGVKPIVGMEANLAPHGHKMKRAKIDDRPFHLTLLAANDTGYRNLMLLSSIGFLEGFYYRPRIDKDLLREHHEGIIALSGCLRGEIPRALVAHDAGQAESLVREYQNIFGTENFYLELVHRPELPEQGAVNARLIELSKKTGAPLAATRNAHYLHSEDGEIRRIVLAIQLGKTVDELRGEDVDQSLSSAEEMIAAFSDVPEAIDNTALIAGRCNLELELDRPHFPQFEVPDGKTADEYLRELAFAGLLESEGPLREEYRSRLEHELNIIAQKGYSAYFLIVADFVLWAREKGIVATTRGSAAGSLVSYATGITTVNPLNFKLPFERFLNPYRPSPPDIDMDFADTRRDEVIEYVTNKYGKDKVAQICTFGAMLARGSVRDVGRALGLPYAFCDKVAKMIPFGTQGFAMTIDRAKRENPELSALYAQDEQAKRLLDLAERIEGNARHVSVHAAGVVISPTPLTDFTPLQRESGGERVITQYEMYSVESAGLVKMDFLGIRNLSILDQARRIVKRTKGVEVDLRGISLDDKRTFAMLARGETVGLFQLGGTGMTRYLVQLKPSRVHDIMAMVALFRPGPMESIPEYIKRKHNPRLIKYIDPRMEKILEISYGVVTYQDDVLLLAMELAGYNWETVDKLRKAMGKKIPEEMAKQKEKFIGGCQEHGGLSRDDAQALWKLIEPFAAYGFNKCLPGDTVLTDAETGERMTIEELYCTNKRMMLWTLGEDLKLEAKQMLGVQSNGIKTVYELITRTGRRIRATANHPFMTFEGWRELGELRTGDRMVVPRLFPKLKRTRHLVHHELVALGYLLSEGNLCHPYGVYFYSKSQAECDDFVRAAEKFENTKIHFDYSKSAIAVYVGKKDRRMPNGLMQWIDVLGLRGKRATEKSFPSIVFSLPREELAVLLGKLWQGDGCVWNKRYDEIFYATSSWRLACELQHLLLRLDIVSVIHAKRFAYRGGWKYGWTVHVSKADQVQRFACSIGKYLIGEKHMTLQSIRSGQDRCVPIGIPVARGTFDTVPAAVYSTLRRAMGDRCLSANELAKTSGMHFRLFYRDMKKKGYTRETLQVVNRILKNQVLERYAYSDVLWDEVKEIRPCGEEETFDVIMPAPHNFVANDIIVHNSHACSYGLVAYQTAYMKANFPAEYMTAVLTAESHDLATVAEVVAECRKMGIAVLPPDINESRSTFTYIDDRQIRFGLLAIKNLGEDIIRAIIEERDRGVLFKDLADFMRRVPVKSFNRKSLEALIRSGALDKFGERKQLFESIDVLLAFRREAAREQELGQSSLFGLADPAQTIKLRAVPPAGHRELLAWERELLGLYVSAHPFSEFAQALGDAVIPASKITPEMSERTIRVAGMISSVKEITTRSGDPMLFVRLEDGTSSVEALVFPRLLMDTREIWREEECVVITGAVSARDTDPKIICHLVWPLNKNNLESTVRALRNSKPVRL